MLTIQNVRIRVIGFSSSPECSSFPIQIPLRRHHIRHFNLLISLIIEAVFNHSFHFKRVVQNRFHHFYSFRDLCYLKEHLHVII